MGRFILTVIVIFVVAAVVLTVAGALHFQNTPDETRVTLDKKELNQKTQELMGESKEAGSKALKNTGEALHKAGEDLHPSHDQPAPSAKPDNQQPGQRDNNSTTPLNPEHDLNL